MCQLLGMNCNVPTDIVFSFEGFCQRGGQTDHHKDGWGIAFFEDKGVRLFVDYQPSAESQLATFIRQYPIKSMNVVSHIRKATQGNISLANTHPFRRELWGYYWIFAHNGNLENLPPLSPNARFQPVGTTDSEQAFCWLLNQLAQTYSARPNHHTLFSTLNHLLAEIAHYGTFNILLSDGTMMLAHCATELFYSIRHTPFATAQLLNEAINVEFGAGAAQIDRVAVIATQPLTPDEIWTKMRAKDTLLFVDGVPLLRN
jgi:glutamine amidotransferase